jgi:hypothetical protein
MALFKMTWKIAYCSRKQESKEGKNGKEGREEGERRGCRRERGRVSS